MVACSVALAALGAGARERNATEAVETGPAGTAPAVASPAGATQGRNWSVQRALIDLREVSYPRYGWLRQLANRVRGPVRIGLQIGHLDAASAPDELANLRQSTGGSVRGLDEVEVNQAVAEALAARLTDHGFEVDLLGAVVPPNYRADLLLSIHADANSDEDRRGYKSAHFRPARNPHEALLKVAVDRAYTALTRLPDDDRNVSGNMLLYYAFNHRRFQHSVHRETPALLVELGYLSNADDRAWLERPDRLAAALENGVLDYLAEIRRIER